MIVRYKGNEQDRAIIDDITDRVHASMAGWYGDSRQILSGVPEIRSYTNSFLLRYEVSASVERPAILVKIRRSPKMDSLSEAIQAGSIHANIPDEYRSMQFVYEKIGDEHPSFAAIRPLAFYEQYYAIVMEEFASRSLRQMLEKPKTHADQRDRLPLLKEAACKAGQLVRYFHEVIQSTTEYHYSADQIMADVELQTARLEQYSNGQVSSRSLRKAFEQKLAGREIGAVPFSETHQDLTCDNVLYSANGRVCLIDIKTKPGPIYSDLALLLIHPETFRSQIFRGGLHFSDSLLQSYRHAILEGYFAQNHIDPFFINLFCAIRVLDKWIMHTELLYRYKGLKRMVTRPLVPVVNRYFEALLTRYLRQVTS